MVQVDRSLEETQLVAPLDSFQSAPAYDSGWYDLGIRPDPLSVLFTHNLGGDPDDYVILLTCKDDSVLQAYNCTDGDFNKNAHWYALTNSTVSVWVTVARPDEIRVRIYQITPAFDSGWEVLLPRPDSIPVDFTHNLGRDVYIHVVSLECKDETSLGTYDCTDDAFNINASWYNLNGTTITAWVRSGPRPDEIRLRLFAIVADYDSSWLETLPRAEPTYFHIDHNLGEDPEDYIVFMECRDASSYSRFDCIYSTFAPLMNWYDLTDSSLRTWAVAGVIPDEVRIRILIPQKLYLPMVVKE